MRGAVVDAVHAVGGSCTLEELCRILRRKRPRDLVRRKTSPKGRDGLVVWLEEAGVLTVEEDVVALTEDWADRLEDARESGGELEAEELARRRYRDRSRAFHRRHEAPKSKPSAVGLEAVRRSRESRKTHLQAQQPPAQPGETALSPLAVAIRDYLDRNPHQARQPAGWIGSTLWAYERYPGKPTPAESRAAIDELGGAAYLDAKLKEAKDAA